MVCHSDASLDELLAEPIVALLMRRDGVSLNDARGLFETVGRQLREGAGAPGTGRLPREESKADRRDCRPAD